MISTKELQAGMQLPKLGIEILLRQQPSAGGSALLVRVTGASFAVLARTGARSLAPLTLAMGLRHACVYDL